MSCKNCEYTLKFEDNYCPQCGAKVIKNRLTFKNLWEEINERVFNLDNNFFRTFLFLFTKPHEVINGYVHGVRKKYMDPVSYLGIALTFSGLFLFILRKYFFDKLSFEFPGSTMDSEAMRKVMLVTMDFNSFVFLFYIPVVTLAGWLMYNNRRYLLTEYLVQSTYSLAHFSLFTIPLSILILLLAPESFLAWSMPEVLLMALYCTYVTAKIHGWKSLSAFLFLIGFGIGFIAIGLILNIIFLATGILTLGDFVPQLK